MSKNLLACESVTKFKLDPRTKIILMIFLNMVIFSGNTSPYVTAIALMPIVLIALSGKVKRAFVCGLCCILSGAAYIFLAPLLDGVLNLLIVMVSYTLYRMMPAFIMGYYLVTTTTVSEFVASMERIHMPRQIVIPMSVMFRFFPTVAQEAASISDAMRMRGIKFGLNALEYRLIPLMMSTVKIGDELSAASLTRGLGSPVKRTNICQIGFHLQDIIFLIIMLVCFGILTYVRWGI